MVGESLRSIRRRIMGRLEGYTSRLTPKNNCEDSVGLWKYINQSGWQDDKSVGPAKGKVGPL